MDALVGIDVGTTAVKGIAIGTGGGVVDRAECGYALSTPRPGWAEQDPEDWWRATEEVFARLAVTRPIGIGLSGQMHGLVALDARDAVVRPAILWNDQRTAAQCRAIEDEIGLDGLIARTGNRALPGFTAPKLLWLREHEPDAYARIATVMLPKDYVRMRITGARATDVADASGTLLLDVAARTWSPDLAASLGIDPGVLPTVLESPAVAGWTRERVPVAAGAGDQAAAAVGVGVVRPGRLSVSLGTSGVVFAPLGAYAPDPRARLHTFCHAVPGGWHSMGVMLSAGGSLRWLRDVAAPGASYAQLTAEADAWDAGVEGLAFLPYLTGERTPHDDPDARASFTGLEIRHDRGALVRAVLEGVAFALRDSFELISEAGVRPTVVRASGGGARSELWLRIVASVLGVPVEPTRVDEGAALGAALLAGVAGDTFVSVDEAVAACVRVRDAIEPEASWVAAYEDGYARFRAMYPSLHPRTPGVRGAEGASANARALAPRGEHGIRP